VYGAALSWRLPTFTTTNWPLIVLGLPSLFLVMNLPITEPRYLRLGLSKYVLAQRQQVPLACAYLRVEARKQF
jgi:hypothetical protein